LKHSLKCYKSGNLFVGDSKFGSIGNRGYVVQNEDYYLMPLSLIQLSKTEREELIKESIVGEYKQVLKKKQEEEILIAEGFEVKQALESIIDETSYKWEERRLFVRSVNYAKSQKSALDRRLNKAHRSLLDLGDSKQGKRVPKTRIDYLGRIANILKTNRVEGLIGFDIKENQTTKIIRAYGKYPEREVTESDFSLDCWLKEEEIEERKLYLGWQVYATNTSIDLLSFEQCVWKYRQQSNIESRFDDLRNKMAPLLPVFLQKDNRIEGLVNILLLALKICSTMEYVIAKALQDQNEKLCGVYEGNPKRGTVRPSAKRLLKAFEGISISLIFIDKQFQFALMTKLETVQLKILKLLGIKTEIYTDLPSKIEMFFSKNKITET
jgi:transposase